MLKRHSLSPLRRRMGRWAVGLLVLMSAGVVVATQAGQSAKLVELKFEGQIGAQKFGPGRLITALGVPATVGVGEEGGARWEVKMTATQLPDGQLQVLTTYRSGSPLVDYPGTHTQQNAVGQPIELNVGEPGSPGALRLWRMVQLVDAAPK